MVTSDNIPARHPVPCHQETPPPLHQQPGLEQTLPLTALALVETLLFLATGRCWFMVTDVALCPADSLTCYVLTICTDTVLSSHQPIDTG